MSKKVRVNISVDEKLFKDFQRVLPNYISVSGVLEALVREYMAGYYKFDWSIDEMFDVLRGKTAVTYLQRVHELGVKDFPQDIKDSAVADKMYEESLQEEADCMAAIHKERETEQGKDVVGKKIKFKNVKRK